MNITQVEEDTEDSYTCASFIFHPITKFVSLLKVRHSVHPKEPLNLEYSEFLKIDNKIKLRVLHIKPEDAGNVTTFERNSHEAVEKRYSINRSSLTEEYWFTQWNKPLPINCCNCSFRRSQRYSKLSDQLSPTSLSSLNENVHMSDLLPLPTTNRLSNFDTPATKIQNIETFVERLIQDTIFEALQEYYITKNHLITHTHNHNGVDNLGYVKSEDDVDSSVVIRKYNNKEPAILETECKPVKTRTKPSKRENRNNCAHIRTRKENKPFIILLHGIGGSADIWWIIIQSFLKRGYEVAAPDLLGHGYSSAPKKSKYYRFKNLLNHALAVYDYYAQQDEKRKFIIIGHSFGCSLATALARYRPQQIVQLVLISGGGPTSLSAPVASNEISVFGCLQILISPLLFCGIKRSFFYSPRGKHFQPYINDKSIPDYVLEYIDIGQNWPEGDAAFHRRILIPTLLVHGLKDTQVTLVQECEMERTIPRAFLELIPTAGHMSVLETPEQLSHMILCFIDWWSR